MYVLQAEPERFVKDTSTLGRVPSANKKSNHLANGVAVIPKSEPSPVITNGTPVLNGVGEHKSHDYGEGGGGTKERGRSKERSRPIAKMHGKWPLM